MTYKHLVAVIAIQIISGCSSNPSIYPSAESNAQKLNEALLWHEKNASAEDLISGTAELFPAAKGIPSISEAKGKIATTPRVKRMFTPTKPSPLGKASVALLIDEQGKVIDSKVITSSSGAIALYAKDMASQIEFLPATLDGNPIQFGLVAPIVVFPPHSD